MYRQAGIFLPIFSLPSKYGIGDFGESSYRFIDIISENGFKLWQILPLNPVTLENYNSPYLSPSLFAGNPLFISLEFLMKENLIDERDLVLPSFKEDEVDYQKIYEFKQRIFDISYENFLKFKKKDEFYNFSNENSYWLFDFSLFNVLKKYFKKSWKEWPEKLKKRDEKTLKEFERIFKKEIEKEKFIQYIFFKEFSALKRYANEKNIKIIGDLPIYPSYDSSDVWANQDIFKLDEDGDPLYVAGAPPDYFSEKGQLWGNPVYDWEKLKEKKFYYWIKRIEHSLKLYDYLRLDHFRGFIAYYEIPYGREDATEGNWVNAFPYDFLSEIYKKFGKINIVAEDLGYITPDVIELMRKFDIPGTKVFLFGFQEKDPKNWHLPHNYEKNSFAYTSTHDTNTLRGWIENEIDEETKDFLFDYINKRGNIEDIIFEIMRILMISPANAVIFPIQDILFLDKNARINIPGKKEGNWKFRINFNLFEEFKKRIKELNKFIRVYGR